MPDLYLVRMPVDPGRLGRWAVGRNLAVSRRKARDGRLGSVNYDEGAALHHLLAETFGKGVLQPFRLFTTSGETSGNTCGNLYAYTSHDAEALHDMAQTVGLPDALAVIALDQLMAKPMPGDWREGRRLGFDLRLRPTMRLIKPLASAPREETPANEQSSAPARPAETPFRKGAEVDAFLVEAFRRFPAKTDPEKSMAAAGLTRERTYVNWLAARLDGVATLGANVRLKHFIRRLVSRHGVPSEGPDIVLQGDLTISDPARFTELIANGVGRHRAYGYGMLLLRPPSVAGGG